ncbi:MAG: hypothetical protein ACRD5H_08835, partial [Nitrososphaerales archaeon]
MISQYIPVITAAASVIAIAYRASFRLFKMGSVGKWKPANFQYENLISLAVIVIIFAYFARIPIDTGMPPIGDAILHSSLTSMIVGQGQIIKDTPFPPFEAVYPQGYHAFSGNISLLLNLNPAESVYILSVFLLITLSSSLLTLTRTLTNIYWLSLPMPFVVLIVHNSKHLETWITGYLFNGPYPTLFGFLSVVTIITLLQISSRSRQSILELSPAILLLAISLFVTYPTFIIHIASYVVAYILTKRLGEKTEMKQRRLTAVTGSLVKSEIQHSSRTNLSYASSISIRNKPLRLGSIFMDTSIISIFVIAVAAGGLVPFFQQMVSFNLYVFSDVAKFESLHPSAAISSQVVWPRMSSDVIFLGLLVLQVAIFIATLILKSRLMPVALGSLIVIMLTFIPGFGFIYPQRTLTLIAALAWPVIAYGISMLLPMIRHKALQRHNAALIGFIAVIFAIEAPHIYDHAVRNYG